MKKVRRHIIHEFNNRIFNRRNLDSKLLKNEAGSAIVLVALSIVVLLGITGLVIDGGTLYMTKSHLQKTANASVLSGAQELTQDEEAVTQVVHEVLHSHNEKDHLKQLEIVMEEKVSIDLEKEIPLTFMKIVGKDTALVKAHAAAEIDPLSKATGVVPLGIDEAISLNYYQEYTLKYDESGVDQGNFGVLALGSPGASTYEDNLTYGYQDYIEIGDLLDTQTGNIAGPTKRGVKARLDSCPYLAGETHHRDCPRIVLLPVYKEMSDKGGKKEVKVTGFAYFYILEPVNDHDKTITGLFIKRAGSGFVDAGTVDKGAYGIRLTE